MPDHGGRLAIVVRGTEIVGTDPPRLARQKLARITLDSMVQFVGLLDAQGTVLEINKVALDAVGVELAEVEGKPFWTTFWWQVSDEIRAILRESIARAAQGEFVRWDTEIYGRAGGKETIVIDASLCPVADDDGNVVFICAEGRDITAKKAQEREIAAKNVELQGLLERIRELDEIKTQFFANVSHELRTPLALILGPAQRLSDDDGTMDRAQRRESAQVVTRNARMLLKHVNDLLDMSKLEAGKLKIELQDVDVAALTRFLASHFAVLADERGIALTVDAGEPCPAAVDPDKLQRVFMNLLANAFKFTPAGGSVRCALQRSAHELRVTVDDSGPGVEPSLRKAIFERFRQGDGGSNRKVGGTGLGLAIAKEFVEMHQGRIEVTDSDLGGARFEVMLPLHRTTAGALAGAAGPEAGVARDVLDGLIAELQPSDPPRVTALAAAAASATPGAGVRPRILVVEDNADMNRFVTQCLAADYEVISAFDGGEGLEMALRFLPALVVSDIMMPKVSGDEMVARMRQQPELRQTPILLLSAKADEALMVKLLDSGAQDFIVKPFSERDLAVRVRNLVLAQQARSETELQKRLLHSLFMQAPALIAVLRGPQHRIELANPPICQVWGHTEREVMGRPFFEVMAELGDLEFPSLLDKVYREGTPYVGKETRVTFDRGEAGTETLFLNFVYSPLRNAGGQIDGIFVIASDVTEQVVARQQVDGLRQAAEAASRAKDEFLAMLGHELRNPLSPVVTALELMKLQDPHGSERARTIIERQVHNLIRLVDDLLDVSRIARGKVELKTETVEIAEVLAEAIETASPLVEQRAHTLRVEVAASGLSVNADTTRLSQVISNLLTNAAKYTPPGGEIAVAAARLGDEVVLRVRDTGIGIAPEILPHIFDLFVQDRQTVERAQGGLGIGLTIVRNLVERHGGSVSAHSAGPGLGSEFVVRLPASVATADPAGALQAPTGPPDAVLRAGAPRVLVVDDNEDAATTLAQLLAHLGHDTRVAHDAPAALRIAADFLPDVAVVDIGLPVMDGYELAAHLREMPGLADLHLIALTGYSQESDRRKSQAAGFDHHLVKPVGVDALEAAMSAASRR